MKGRGRKKWLCFLILTLVIAVLIGANVLLYKKTHVAKLSGKEMKVTEETKQDGDPDADTDIEKTDFSGVSLQKGKKLEVPGVEEGSDGKEKKDVASDETKSEDDSDKKTEGGR